MVGGVPSGEFQPPLLTGSPAPVVSGGGVEVVSPVDVVSPPPLLPPGPGVRGPPGRGVSWVPVPDGAVTVSASEQAHSAKAATNAAARWDRYIVALLRHHEGEPAGPAGFSAFDGQAVSERPMALRTGLATGVP